MATGPCSWRPPMVAGALRARRRVCDSRLAPALGPGVRAASVSSCGLGQARIRREGRRSTDSGGQTTGQCRLRAHPSLCASSGADTTAPRQITDDTRPQIRGTARLDVLLNARAQRRLRIEYGAYRHQLHACGTAYGWVIYGAVIGNSGDEWRIRWRLPVMQVGVSTAPTFIRRANAAARMRHSAALGPWARPVTRDLRSTPAAFHDNRYNPMILQDRITEVVRRLREAYQPERIYLFGSVARGDMSVDSDIDILLVVPDDASAEHRSGRIGYEILWGLPMAVDVVVWTHSAFDRRARVPSSLPATVLREGKLLHAA